jgi:hypothetical protein
MTELFPYHDSVMVDYVPLVRARSDRSRRTAGADELAVRSPSRAGCLMRQEREVRWQGFEVRPFCLSLEFLDSAGAVI